MVGIIGGARSEYERESYVDAARVSVTVIPYLCYSLPRINQGYAGPLLQVTS